MSDFLSNKILYEGLAFDDVLVLPRYSEVLPREVVTRTKLTRNLEINVPILSAAMDTVTEGKMAISMARAGGIGFIHKNMSIERQAAEVKKSKTLGKRYDKRPCYTQGFSYIERSYECHEGIQNWRNSNN